MRGSNTGLSHVHQYEHLTCDVTVQRSGGESLEKDRLYLFRSDVWVGALHTKQISKPISYSQ